MDFYGTYDSEVYCVCGHVKSKHEYESMTPTVKIEAECRGSVTMAEIGSERIDCRCRCKIFVRAFE